MPKAPSSVHHQKIISLAESNLREYGVVSMKEVHSIPPGSGISPAYVKGRVYAHTVFSSPSVDYLNSRLGTDCRLIRNELLIKPVLYHIVKSDIANLLETVLQKKRERNWSVSKAHAFLNGVADTHSGGKIMVDYRNPYVEELVDAGLMRQRFTPGDQMGHKNRKRVFVVNPVLFRRAAVALKRLMEVHGVESVDEPILVTPVKSMRRGAMPKLCERMVAEQPGPLINCKEVNKTRREEGGAVLLSEKHVPGVGNKYTYAEVTGLRGKEGEKPVWGLKWITSETDFARIKEMVRDAMGDRKAGFWTNLRLKIYTPKGKRSYKI